MPIVIGDFSPPPELVLLELVLLLELPHAAISGTSPTRSAAMADLRKIFITSPRLDVSIARCAYRDPIDGEPNGKPRATTSPPDCNRLHNPSQGICGCQTANVRNWLRFGRGARRGRSGGPGRTG